MNKSILKIAAVTACAVMLASFASCGTDGDTQPQTTDPQTTVSEKYEGAAVIELSESTALFNGVPVEEYDYTWHCDPSAVHDEVKNAPAEYHTGEKPEETPTVYIDRDLCYYPELPEEDFKLVNYDGEKEWAYYYTDGENDEYIFATLPNLGKEFPSQMMHSEEEASKNKVLHITEAGTYVLTGSWNGQVKIDLGDEDETFTDASAKVTVILNGVNITNTVAPGIVFYSAYECDNTWEERDEYSVQVDTADAGVNVIIADGTENTVNGTNVFRMLKTKYKDEDDTVEIKTQKKMRKTDAAFYSYVTMNISGEAENSGKLTVESGFEGLDSELHLTFNGGNIVINSQDDGINVNEDNVSVVFFNGGDIELNAAQGAEGDGVDSNGFVVINGGKISVNGIVAPDSAIDSEDGIYYNGGEVVIDGVQQQYTAGSVFNKTGRTGGEKGGFGGRGGFEQMPENFDIAEFKAKVAELPDDATWQDVLNVIGLENFGGERPEGMQPEGEAPPEMPGGMEPPQF